MPFVGRISQHSQSGLPVNGNMASQSQAIKHLLPGAVFSALEIYRIGLMGRSNRHFAGAADLFSNLHLRTYQSKTVVLAGDRNVRVLASFWYDTSGGALRI